MSHPALSRHPLTTTAVHLAPRLGQLLTLSIAALGAALYAPGPASGIVLLSAGMALLFTTLLVQMLNRRDRRARKSFHDTIAGFVEQDASPSFTTDRDGVIGYRNRAAEERFESHDGQTLIAALGEVFASPAATLCRLQNRAVAHGAAREDVVLRRGHLRLSVHQIGDDGFLWRFEELADRGAAGRGSEGISLPMMTVSKAGTVLFMNEAMRRLLGGREKTLDRIFTDLPLRPGQLHEVCGVDGRISARICIIDSSAGRSEVYVMPQVSGAGLPQGQDWTLFDDLPVPLLKVTPNGTILTCNRPARQLLALHEGQGANLGDLVEGLGRPIVDWLEATAASKSEQKPEFVRASRQAQEVYFQISLSPVLEGQDTVLVAVLHDATKLKTLEAQFVQSQKMQAIGQLAGGVAHDFNNLLTAISGHCDLLLLRHDQGDQDFADLVQIHQNANRAASLVGQLLAFSRKQTLQPEVIEIREVLDDLAHLLGRLVGEKVSLVLDHDDATHTIRADKRQLEQVIMNLVVNARDAMPDGGEVRNETRLEVLTKPYERDRATVQPGRYVVVSVSDQGVGITPDRLPKIFEPFYTTKRTGEGTGLGLSMAYGIVKQTGGFIFADSVPGSGTRFTLYLPAHAATGPVPVKAIAAVPKPTHGPAGGVILLVEDEAPVRTFASRALRMRGYTVLEAENAEEALKTLEDGSLNIDVFVTDVIMPGMDGPSWVAKALEDRPGVKVVFVSGYAEESFAEQQARIPNSVFLPKPFSLSELTATVQGQIH